MSTTPGGLHRHVTLEHPEADRRIDRPSTRWDEYEVGMVVMHLAPRRHSVRVNTRRGRPGALGFRCGHPCRMTAGGKCAP